MTHFEFKKTRKILIKYEKPILHIINRYVLFCVANGTQAATAKVIGECTSVGNNAQTCHTNGVSTTTSCGDGGNTISAEACPNGQQTAASCSPNGTTDGLSCIAGGSQGIEAPNCINGGSQ